ncbi:hemerythrin domain-containing protein [Nocardioides euryhalodurans]|nr:hemerythrin domain-containing protein [Nocardioides euryhalodurans]
MTVDTRMNSIIHAALCRDLDRTALLVDRPSELEPERLTQLGTHLVWMMDLLHDHHTTEDTRLFPAMRANNPAARELLDQMDTEHQAIADAMGALTDAGRRAASGDAGAVDAIRTALPALRTVLDPHLAHEEQELAPLVPQSMGEAEWAAFEKSNTEGKAPPVLAFQGHWMLDNLGDEHAAVVKAQVPAVPRFVMLRLLGGPYRRRRTAVWGGTAAADVRSRPLTPA